MDPEPARALARFHRKLVDSSAVHQCATFPATSQKLKLKYIYMSYTLKPTDNTVWLNTASTERAAGEK